MKKAPKYSIEFIYHINSYKIREFRPPEYFNHLIFCLLTQFYNCIKRPNNKYKIYITVFNDYINCNNVKVPYYKPLSIIVKNYLSYLLASILIALLFIILICSVFDIRVF